MPLEVWCHKSCNSFLLRTYIPEQYNPSTLCSALLRAQPPLAVVAKRGRKRWPLTFWTLLLELAPFLDPVGAPKLLRTGVVPHAHAEDRRPRESGLEPPRQHARRKHRHDLPWSHLDCSCRVRDRLHHDRVITAKGHNVSARLRSVVPRPALQYSLHPEWHLEHLRTQTLRRHSKLVLGARFRDKDRGPLAQVAARVRQSQLRVTLPRAPVDELMKLWVRRDVSGSAKNLK
jgi:hypothetical protein